MTVARLARPLPNQHCWASIWVCCGKWALAALMRLVQALSLTGGLTCWNYWSRGARGGTVDLIRALLCSGGSRTWSIWACFCHGLWKVGELLAFGWKLRDRWRADVHGAPVLAWSASRYDSLAASSFVCPWSPFVTLEDWWLCAAQSSIWIDCSYFLAGGGKTLVSIFASILRAPFLPQHLPQHPLHFGLPSLL